MPILAIGSSLVISGQLYPKSGIVRTSVTVTGLCDDDVNSVRVKCGVNPHVKQITRQPDGSLVFHTTDFVPDKFSGQFATDTMPITLVGEPTLATA